MKKIIICVLTLVCSQLVLFAQQPERPVRETIEDNSIVYPESMTEQLVKLLHDWQIDFSKSENDCSRGANVVFHDSVYTQRLHRMPTEMELSFNHVVKSHIEMYAGRRRDQVSYMLALGDYYFPMFEEALDKYNMPLELKYLPVIESALNPVAVSRAGAAGLWQFMLRTGQGYGLEVNSLVDERRDPYKATEAAVRYLRDLHLIYNDWNLVIAAYNCGPGNVNKAIARSGGKRDYWEIYYHLPRETRGYVPAFIAANYIMNHYADHNICPVHSFDTMNALDTVHVRDQVHFEQIAGVLDISVSELRRLNPQFKKDVVPGNFKEYSLVLPTQKMYAFVDKKDEIAAYNRARYATHRTNTDGYLAASSGNASGGSATNVYYRVRKGDNLSKIATRNGVSVAQLRSWNGLKSNSIAVGRRLIVKKRAAPATAPRRETQQETQLAQAGTNNAQPSATQTVNEYYRVRKGDTLGEIARKNRITVAQLRSWNGLKSNNISIGKNLVVKKKTVAAAPSPTSSAEEGSSDYTRGESSSDGSNIISDYLKEQMGKSNTEENENAVSKPEEETAL